MDWKGREQGQNVEDRRGSRDGGGGKMPGILGIIVVLVDAYYNMDLSGLVGGSFPMGVSTQQASQLDSQQEAELKELSRVVLAGTGKAWSKYFRQHGRRYTPTTMVLYESSTSTACGTDRSAMGPFYCPGDQRVYLDLSFYKDVRAKLESASDAAFAYVIAHRVDHHVQNLFGILPRVHEIQQQVGKKEANTLFVKPELQADCFAGIWGHCAVNNSIFKTEDIQEAMPAAESVGDDRLQKQAQGCVVPDSFTHGSSEERMTWLKRGLESGDINQCNTSNN